MMDFPLLSRALRISWRHFELFGLGLFTHWQMMMSGMISRLGSAMELKCRG
jgi:hypothetical protein